MIAFERLLPYAYCGSLASVAAMAMKEPCASLHVGTGRRLGEQSARGCRQPRLRVRLFSRDLAGRAELTVHPL